MLTDAEKERQSWIDSAEDYEGVQRTDRLEGRSYITNCHFILRDNEGFIFQCLHLDDGRVRVGLDNYFICARELLDKYYVRREVYDELAAKVLHQSTTALQGRESEAPTRSV